MKKSSQLDGFFFSIFFAETASKPGFLVETFFKVERNSLQPLNAIYILAPSSNATPSMMSSLGSLNKNNLFFYKFPKYVKPFFPFLSLDSRY